ncbi:MAG: hypothetical protein JO220_19660 [Hyphomicrobiales bacterium]|nr:hypothetical protein [Hyphomicrobiales bacterium]
MAFAHVIPVPIVSAHVPPAVTIAVPMAHAVPIAVAVAHAGTVAVPITRAVPIAVAIARAGPVAVPIPRAVAIARAGPVAVTITRAVPIAVARTVLAVFLAAHALATMLAGRAGLIVRVGLPAGSAGLVLPHAGAAGPHAPTTLYLRHGQARPGHKRRGRGGRQENTSHCCFLTCSAPLGLITCDNASARALFLAIPYENTVRAGCVEITSAAWSPVEQQQYRGNMGGIANAAPS